MNNEEQNDFDAQFDLAFEKAATSISNPLDASVSWKKVQKKIKWRAKVRKGLMLAPPVAAAFVLGALIFSGPTVTTAFSPFMHSIQTIQKGVVTLIFGNEIHDKGDARTTAPSTATNEGNDITPSALEEEKHYDNWPSASSQLSFGMYKLEDLQNHYHMKDIRLYFKSREAKAHKAVLVCNKETGQSPFILTLEVLDKSQSLSSSSDQKSGRSETVDINGIQAYLFVTNDGRTNLEYLMGNVHISITGSLTQDEVMNVAKNIK